MKKKWTPIQVNCWQGNICDHQDDGEATNEIFQSTKFFKESKQEQWDAFKYLVGYFEHEQANIKFTKKLPEKMIFIGLVDTNFTTDKEENHKFTGGIYTIDGSIISWELKTQKEDNTIVD